jgi:hypothetical protein
LGANARLSTNLLLNPGFESGLSSWTTDGIGVFGIYTYPLPVHEGTNELYLQSSYNVTPHYAFIYQDVAGSAGQTYVASVWARDYPTYATTMQLGLEFHDASGAFISQAPPRQTVNTNYTQMVTRGVAPAGTAKVRIVLMVYSSATATGVADFDDASLRVMAADPPVTDNRDDFYGNKSAVIDTSFPWFSGRSPESIAEEVQAKGFGSARIFGPNIKPDLVKALHGFGLPVIGCVIGNGVYSTNDLPPGSASWRMQVRSPISMDFVYLCKNEPAFLAWLQDEIVNMAKSSGIDSVEVAEAFWPAHGGPTASLYGCLCPRCVAKFTKETGEAPPDFVQPANSLYWTNVPALYAKWVAARSSWTTEFLDKLCNDATNGIRTRCPGLKVILWGIASTDADPARMLEWEGVDGKGIVAKAHPDAYVVQTDWTDWTNPNLQPDYVLGYSSYIQEAKSGAADIPVLIQTDCGSWRTTRRSSVWLSQCDAAAKEAGASGLFAYMLPLEQDVYQSNLCVLATRDLGQSVRIVLNKWPALTITNLASWQAQGADITTVSRDGCTVVVQLTNRTSNGHINLTWQPVSDDPSVKFDNGDLPACAWGGTHSLSLPSS